MQVQCLKCKGRGFCGRTFCAIIAKSKAQFKVKKDVGSSIPDKDFQSSAPTPFIGRSGYPYVNVGILSPAVKVEDSWEYDSPRHWSKSDFQSEKIIELRSSLVNSRSRAGVMETNKFVEAAQLVGISKKPVDVEVNLKDKPRFSYRVDSHITPMGPSANVEKVNVCDNVSVERPVERAIDDFDLKSVDALRDLYKRGYDENVLNKILSVGVLGRKRARKLVPTRWGITAVDDNLGKDLIKEVKDFSESDSVAFFGGYLGNYYLVLLFSDAWSYELFETYLPNTGWNTSSEIQFSTDFEPYSGRTSYAENCAGGYYAARLPILEELKLRRRQGSVLALRFITGDYGVPLGVWVCREACRKALLHPIQFSDKELMIKYAKLIVKKKFNYDLDVILNESHIIKAMKTQTKLSSFFG